MDEDNYFIPDDPDFVPDSGSDNQSLSESFNRGYLGQENAGKGLLGKSAALAGEGAGPILGGTLGLIAGGPPGAALGAALGYAGQQGYRNLLARYNPDAGIRTMGPAETTARAGVEGGLNYLTAGAARLAPATSEAAKAGLSKGFAKTGAQVMRAMTGIPEREGVAVLRDPSILSRATSSRAAGEAYAESLGGLKSGIEGYRQSFGKSYMSADKLLDVGDELRPMMQSGGVDTQKALSLRQMTMDKLSSTSMAEKDLRRALSRQVDELDDYLEKLLPDWPSARQGYREAKIGEEFSSWLPLNKNLSPNVLRTTAAIAAATKGAAEGHLWPALALPAVSPKVWGMGIKTAAAASQATKDAILGVAPALAARSISQYYASPTR